VQTSNVICLVNLKMRTISMEIVHPDTQLVIKRGCCFIQSWTEDKIVQVRAEIKQVVVLKIVILKAKAKLRLAFLTIILHISSSLSCVLPFF